MNNNHLAFYRRLACVVFAGLVTLPLVGCGGGGDNTVVEAASEAELNMSDAELSGVTEEEYEQGMNEL